MENQYKLVEFERAIKIAAEEVYENNGIEDLIEREAISYKDKEEWIEWKIDLWKRIGEQHK